MYVWSSNVESFVLCLRVKIVTNEHFKYIKNLLKNSLFQKYFFIRVNTPLSRTKNFALMFVNNKIFSLFPKKYGTKIFCVDKPGARFLDL